MGLRVRANTDWAVLVGCFCFLRACQFVEVDLCDEAFRVKPRPKGCHIRAETLCIQLA